MVHSVYTCISTFARIRTLILVCALCHSVNVCVEDLRRMICCRLYLLAEYNKEYTTANPQQIETVEYGLNAASNGRVCGFAFNVALLYCCCCCMTRQYNGRNYGWSTDKSSLQRQSPHRHPIYGLTAALDSRVATEAR